MIDVGTVSTKTERELVLRKVVTVGNTCVVELNTLNP